MSVCGQPLCGLEFWGPVWSLSLTPTCAVLGQNISSELCCQSQVLAWPPCHIIASWLNSLSLSIPICKVGMPLGGPSKQYLQGPGSGVDTYWHATNGLHPLSAVICHHHGSTSLGWNLALPSNLLGLYTALLKMAKSPSGPWRMLKTFPVSCLSLMQASQRS